MAVSPFTFSGALKLLDPDHHSAMFDKLLGGTLFAGAGAATVVGGPVAGLSVAAFLALVDPKNEATKLLSPLVTNTANWLKGTNGRTQYELIVAAHTITVLSSFFDSLKTELSQIYADLEVTQEEMSRLAGLPADANGRGMVAALLEFEVPLPSAERGLAETLEHNIKPWFRQLAERCLRFFEGLEVWQEPRTSADRIARRAAELYRNRMLQLGTQPPFALWLTLNEHAATRAAVQAGAETAAASLSDLRELLAITGHGAPPPTASIREQLALIAEEVLGEPLLRTGRRALASPNVRDGFVEPSFQLAVTEQSSHVWSESWWTDQPVHESLVDYLAVYLASDSSAELPLLLLGHPGAGKSLLTEVLAAQLPSGSFAVIRVPLRRVNTDDDLVTQITKELRHALQRPTASIEELRGECGPCSACRQAGSAENCPHRCRLVVLLDGFDELVQATGVTQSDYFDKIVTFQKRARTIGAATAVMVTSRTMVAEHAEIPPGTPVVKLKEFDDSRIAKWLRAWNSAHRPAADYKQLDVKELTEHPAVAELARQPLLLLILAIYLAEIGERSLGAADITQGTLYGRLLDHFIKRQASEKGHPEAPVEGYSRLEGEQRRNLQFAAFGMFNRGRQHLTDAELDADLAALDPTISGPVTEAQTLRQAHRVLGEFMFVHNAKANREQQHAYEFLHATFGEYLVAELTFDLVAHPERIRAVEASAPGSPADALKDSLLSRLLGHQPLSTRGPVLGFIENLARALDSEKREALLATVSDLLQAAPLQPDPGADTYQPVPYDPLRWRATYTANLTLLRVLMDEAAVPIDQLVGSAGWRGWERLVRLWRAGLDESNWTTVIGRLAAKDETGEFLGGDPSITRRSVARSGPLEEAELLWDRRMMAQLMATEYAFLGIGEPWSDIHLELAAVIGRLLFEQLGTPPQSQLMPHDIDSYEAILELAKAEELNYTSKANLLVLLSRHAERLPYRLVSELVERTIPFLDDEFSVFLAAVMAAHPGLLQDHPALFDVVEVLAPNHAPAFVATLWKAEIFSHDPAKDLLTDFRVKMDQGAAITKQPLGGGYFAPEFFTYLRCERPSWWRSEPDVLGRFKDLKDSELASIHPVDLLYAATEWPYRASELVERYLDLRGTSIETVQQDPILRLQQLVADLEQTDSTTTDLSPTDNPGHRPPN